MLYRLHEALRFGNTRLQMDSINSLKKLPPETIALLIAKSRISEVHPPPLAVIPGFEEKAKVYAEQGIETVNDMSGEEDDFDEALKWSTVEHDSPDFMGSAFVYEMESEDGDELES
jgi:hypothetical protein